MKKSKRSNNKGFKPSKKVVLISLAAIFILIAGTLLIVYKKRRAVSPSPSDSPTGETIIYAPSTEQEKQEVDAHKQEIADQQANTTPPPMTPNGKIQVSPTIVNADSIGVKAYVTGIFEADGTCTATAVQGSQTFTKTSQGFQNASYTQCPPITWDAPLGNGSWIITLSYDSPTASGSSQKAIEVQ